MIEVFISHLDKKVYFEDTIKVKYLLKELGFGINEVLVVKGDRLLTKDLFLKDGDRVEVRLVASRG